MPTAQTPERWIEINLDAITTNVKEIRSHLEPTVKLLAVVKADAYGLGSIPVAKALEPHVDMMAVSTCEEGIELREAEIKAPILVFIPPTAHTAEKLIKHNLIASIDCQESLELLQTFGAKAHPCHLKINSGMNRLGIDCNEAAQLAKKIEQSSFSELVGVYSHLANAANSTVAHQQISQFKKALSTIKDLGIDYKTAHLANSTAIVNLPDSHFDMVRAGTIIYGQSPVKLPANWQLENPWKAFCRIISTRELKKGAAVGYGGDFVAPKNMRIGFIPFGYADGFAMTANTRNNSVGSIFRQSLKNTARLLAKKPLHFAFYQSAEGQKKLPIVGRVGMQITAVDLSNCSLVKDDILQISLRRTSASSRLCRLYLQNDEQTKKRNITTNN